MAYFHPFLAFFCLTFLHFSIHQSMTWGSILINPSEGFFSLPFNRSYYRIQKPYDVLEDQRYSFVDGVHKLWVFSTDKPHTFTSRTKPRTEISIQGYNYSYGVWQFEANGYMPYETSGVCIMQIFGATPPHATTLMLRVYNGSLMHYSHTVLVPRIYDRWFHLNVIHDADAAKLKAFVDGHLKLEVNGHGRTSHTFKCSVYAQEDDSFYMESRWKKIKILRKKLG